MRKMANFAHFLPSYTRFVPVDENRNLDQKMAKNLILLPIFRAHMHYVFIPLQWIFQFFASKNKY